MKNWEDVSAGISRLTAIKHEKKQLKITAGRVADSVINELVKRRDDEINAIRMKYAELIPQEQAKTIKEISSKKDKLNEEAFELEESIKDYVLQSKETKEIKELIEQPYKRDDNSPYEFNKTFREGSIYYRNNLPFTIPPSYSRSEEIQIILNCDR
ncbi:MAG: hypothetical protein AB7E48_00485 [Deferribacterales bacterium]